MNLIVDIGNTKVKLALFDNNQIVRLESSTLKENDCVAVFISKHSDITNSIVSSVRNYPSELISLLESTCKHVVFFNSDVKTPVKNLYESKKTLGYDRLAACIGANYLKPNCNVLIVDAGTAVTFDFVNKKNQYIGGCISPGLEIRFRALNEFTGKLPKLSQNDSFHLIGTNTNDAIISGVQNGFLFEIESYINKLINNYPDLEVFLTGGDAVFIEKNIDCNAVINCNLVLEGLNKILEYNLLILS